MLKHIIQKAMFCNQLLMKGRSFGNSIIAHTKAIFKTPYGVNEMLFEVPKTAILFRPIKRLH